MPSTYLSDIHEIRERAKRHMEAGAVTDAYGADREAVVRLLNEALATELVCYLRYQAHFFLAQGIHAKAAATEFAEHAQEELLHANQIAGRIMQLNGEPDFNPADLAQRSHAEYIVGQDLESMLRADLYAERVAIESYSEIIRFLGEKDPTTRRLMEEILAKEEEHAEDLASLLASQGLGSRLREPKASGRAVQWTAR